MSDSDFIRTGESEKIWLHWIPIFVSPQASTPDPAKKGSCLGSCVHTFHSLLLAPSSCSAQLTNLEQQINALAGEIEEYKIIQSIPGSRPKNRRHDHLKSGEMDRFNYAKNLSPLPAWILAFMLLLVSHWKTTFHPHPLQRGGVNPAQRDGPQPRSHQHRPAALSRTQ